MWRQGQKTKQVHFWMAPEDVALFSDALQTALPSIGWQCSHGGLNPDVHAFDALQDALACGHDNPVSSQAFAPLAVSALQFHVQRMQVLQGAQDGYAPDYVFPDEINVVNCGRMAIRWHTGEADEPTLEALNESLKVIWKTFQRCTLPAKVHTLNGKPLAGFRIGSKMLEIATTQTLYLRANGPFCLPDEQPAHQVN